MNTLRVCGDEARTGRDWVCFGRIVRLERDDHGTERYCVEFYCRERDKRLAKYGPNDISGQRRKYMMGYR